MEILDQIGDRIRQHLEEKNTARDLALQRSRELIRFCSKAIRAVHREDFELASDLLQGAAEIAVLLRTELAPYPDLFKAGYTQSALKEYAEASIVYRLVSGEPLPSPEELEVDYVPYLGGLGEAAGELRRRTLDILRRDDLAEAERLLEMMDDIYGLLVTIDFPDALTHNLRRITDMVRGVTERTRGDLTTTFQQGELKRALQSVEERLKEI